MRRLLSAAAIAAVTLSSVAGAQARRGTMATTENPSPEIGMDAGLTISSGGGSSVTQFDIPARLVRVGFFVSPQLSIEPALALHSVSGGGVTVTDYEVGVGALYHFSPNRAENQVYVRPFINLLGFSGSGASDSDVLFGAGLGVKMPVRPQIATRFEANVGRISSNGSSGTIVGLLAGLSFYTR